MNSLDAFLNQFRQGRLDSSGTFTLDWTRVRKAYEGLSRANPNAFLVKMLQAAFASTAQWVAMEATVQALRLVWTGGSCWQADDFQSLESHVVHGRPLSGSRDLRHLAHLLLLVAGRDDLYLGVENPNGRLALGPSGWTLDLQPQENLYATTVQVNLVAGARRLVPRPSFWQVDLLAPRVTTAWPELLTLTNWAGYNPIPLALNRWKVAGDSRLTHGTQLAFCVLLAPDIKDCGVGFDLGRRSHDNRLFWLDGSQCHQIPEGWSQGQLLRCHSYFEFSVSEYESEKLYSDHLCLVADGVPIHSLNGWWGSEALGVAMAVDASELPVDASTLKLVEGPELQEKIADCRRWVRRFFRKCRAQVLERGPTARTTPAEKEILEAFQRIPNLADAD